MVQSSIYPKRMCLCACVCVRVCTHSSVVEVGRDTLIFIDHLHSSGGFPGGSDGKESACNAGDLDLIPRLGRSPGEGNGTPLQYSCLGNATDRGAWWATVHGVAKSQM